MAGQENKDKSKESSKKDSSKNGENGEKMSLTYYVVYFTASVICILYGFRVFCPEAFEEYSQHFPALKSADLFFTTVEEYSPFDELFNEEILIKKSEELHKKDQNKAQGDRLFTSDELKGYDGSVEGKGPYLALLGHVFDVSKGKGHYGPGGGYGFFSGRDGSRAFVTGKFDEEGLTDDISGLSHQDYLGLKEWLEFYHKDYTYVGKLVGRYYEQDGKETEYARNVQNWMRAAEEDKAQKDVEKQMFPPCNTEWSKAKGHRVWCTNKSGGVNRNWIGVPRRLFYPGRAERCACVRDAGPPSTDPSSKSNNGDLASPHLKEYQGCDSKASSCQLSPPSDDGNDE